MEGANLGTSLPFRLRAIERTDQAIRTPQTQSLAPGQVTVYR